MSLHKIILKCDIISGPVTVGVRHSLPVKVVDLILGNDIEVASVLYMLTTQQRFKTTHMK